jgi:hypothetical protein
MSKLYGLTQIALTGPNRVVMKVKPQRGSTTKEGARWRRQGMRDGFVGITCVSPTRKYVDDYEDGYVEGVEWFERYRRANANVEQEVVYTVGDRVTMREGRLVGTVVRVKDLPRPDSMGSRQAVTVSWYGGSRPSENLRSARQLQKVENHPAVKKVRNLIDRQRFAEEQGDMVAFQNVHADLMEYGDQLTIKHTAHPSFMTLLDGVTAVDYHTNEPRGYVPTLRTDVDAELVALADLYDYEQARRGRPVVAMRA